jgi:hypothetical protein
MKSTPLACDSFSNQPFELIVTNNFPAVSLDVFSDPLVLFYKRDYADLMLLRVARPTKRHNIPWLITSA